LSFVLIAPYFVNNTVSALAANGGAAWRSGGFYTLPFKLPLPAAVAPNRTLCAGILSLIFVHFSHMFFSFKISTVLQI
jgi:hypothetical protein